MSLFDNFKRAFYTLKDNLILIVPLLITILIGFILIFSFLHFSGISKLMADYSSLQKYVKTKQVTEEQLLDYFKVDFMKLVTLSNVITFIFLIIFLFTFPYYFRILSLVLMLFILKKQKLVLRNALELTNKLYFRYVLYTILMFLIIFVPISLIFVGLILIFLINVYFGILSLIPFMIIVFAYQIFIIPKIIFSEPILFIEDKTAFDSVKQSYLITKHHYFDALKVSAVVIAMYVIIQFLPKFVPKNLTYLINLQNPVNMLTNWLLLVVFCSIIAFIATYDNLFLFYSYIDFKAQNTQKEQ